MAVRSVKGIPRQTEFAATDIWCGYVKIYSLSDKNKNIFYIGCTTRSLHARLRDHQYTASSNSLGNVRKANKIHELDGMVFINLIEKHYAVALDWWQAQNRFLHREQYWIKKHIEMGCLLFNKEAIKGNERLYKKYEAA